MLNSILATGVDMKKPYVLKHVLEILEEQFVNATVLSQGVYSA